MPKYRLNSSVPWRKILSNLSWDVDRGISEYQYALERLSGGDPRNLLPFYEQKLQEACESYHALRTFLGYSGSTKVEQRAEKLLCGQEE